ncbi:F-box associated domain-containing protein [Caenorhabditis elegans]|uniref:F-box associated domain-containing protein n=1 Tax=Caenorhabditis elegans TaxID=6239 RepID=O44725_CAEEL|nr:F-box associated domain-containing protein [Caenorhabditis elegans]CCD71533.1 F-box associated domain-containing protein [Caenorhabditis elegans]|eukprot:NP_492847.1 Uncharacterized protein CELE_F49D11.2 [Caenorhabditis elegans]
MNFFPSPESQRALGDIVELDDVSDGYDDTLTTTTTGEGTSSIESGHYYKTFRPEDLFELTMCSEEAKEQIREYKLGITRIAFNDRTFTFWMVDQRFDQCQTKVDIQIIERSNLPGKLKRISLYLKSKIWRKFLSRKINGATYLVEKSHQKEYGLDLTHEGFNYRLAHCNGKYSIYTSDMIAAHRDLFLHLFYVFPSKDPVFFIDLRGIRSEEINVTRDLISIQQINRGSCLAMGVREREFVEDAHKILEMMESLKNLKLDISLRKVEFFSPKMCNIDHLSITYHKNQISEKNLLSLNCETIKLWSVTTSSRSLNKFIKKWLFTFDTRFQYLEIPILHLIEEDSNPWNIFKDLEISAFDEGKRAEYYKRYDWDFETNCLGSHRFINCQRGTDIEREDGMLATIITDSTFFYFFVWHNRFPEQPDHVPYLDR